MKNNIKKILIVKLREVGDLLLTVPVAQAIKEKKSDSYVAFLVNSGTQDVVTRNPLIDKVYVFDRKTKSLPWYKKGVVQSRLIYEIRRECFDLVFDFTGGDRAAAMAYLSGAKERITFRLNQGYIKRKIIYTKRVPLPDAPIHEVDRNLLLVKAMGYSTLKKDPKIYVSAEDMRGITSIFSENKVKNKDIKVHIHPTSKWLFKCWVDSYFASLIDYITERYKAKIFITCGFSEKEQAKAKNIYSLCKKKPVSLIGWNGTLKHLACLSRTCDLFIGIDTGPMHIAAAVGTPVIALFGPSGYKNWGPWGEGHTIVKSVNHPCMPCGRDGCSGSKRSECLEAISVEMMKKAVDNRLSSIV